ncbi:hypothetical protein EVJ58_g10182 [Rhodofomes roseus]|uniref:Uncharacterized protein n=1 Tax=Rhodofomes roseus TaxID=34475 RepID=A0A4Y9XRX0_9APHY|nr:hypothetical protein EVJ58_g10182 [Rhodofomes roseus]
MWVEKITKGSLDVIYDAVSLPDTQLAAYEVLSPGGILVLASYDVIPEERKDSGKRVVRAWGQPNYPSENRVVAAKLYGDSEQLTSWLKEGAIKPNRVVVLPNGLEGILEGLERLRDDRVSGVKLVAQEPA